MTNSITLSKSRLLAYLQCPKRLWLGLHRSELERQSDAAQKVIEVGHQVGDIARQLYDPKGKGVLIDLTTTAVTDAIEMSRPLLGAASGPVFEAGFAAAGARAFADIMLPVSWKGKKSWRMIEVKSSSAVKDYHLDDVAIQSFIARQAGVALDSVVLAHIDSSWIYPGGGDYRGLLVENELTEQAFGRGADVRSWIAAAQVVAGSKEEPERCTGGHCSKPFECGFIDHCRQHEPQIDFPVSCLPGGKSARLKAHLAQDDVRSLSDVPDDLLNERQLRVKQCTLDDLVFFDAEKATAALAEHELPAWFMDFETVIFAVPRWRGTRPFQQIPFQFSVHRLGRRGRLDHTAYLDLEGDDPSRGFAEALIGACGDRGPIYVYNAGFESARIKELAERFPRYKARLLAIETRIVDLLPIAREHFYHPLQQGIWSIKEVLPMISELDYAQLAGIQNGGMAMDAYVEAVSPATSAERKSRIRQELLDYCALDTYALVRLWQFFSGRNDMTLSEGKSNVETC